MRKSFVYAAGLMCLALSITDCQKELVDQTTPASEPNFELFAQPVTTKTANNGLDTKWVAKDAINVFHAEAGSTLYVSDNQFTVKDIETGRFDGTVSKSLSADKSYDWYAFYPYTLRLRHLEIGKSVGLLSAEHHRLRQAMAAVCISPGSLVLSTVSPQMSLLTRFRPFR